MLPAAAELQHHFVPLMPSFFDPAFAGGAMMFKQESPGSSRSDYDIFDPVDACLFEGDDAGDFASGSFLSFVEEPDDRGSNANTVTPKGVQWPGMSMFDSATPEMKRKRNQKKSTNVLKQLEAASAVIVPNEHVFDATGVLRTTRVITGEPESSDSLIEGESEPEMDVQERKRPRRRPRAALAEKHVNTGRVSRQPPASQPLLSHHSRPGAVQDDVDDLTYGAPRPRPRRKISIHRDNSGPEITFEQPGLTHLTAPFRPNGRANVLQPRSNNIPAMPHPQPRPSC